MSLVFPNVTKTKLVDFDIDTQVHGDVLVTAIDMRFSVDMPNDVLALLHPDLRGVLFEESSQGQLDGVEHVSNATELRFPQLAPPFKWVEEVGGNTLVIDYGLGGEGSDILLKDCKLHKVTFQPKRGGTCTVLFTVTAVHGVDESVIGRLGMRVHQSMHIQLIAGEPAAA